MTLAREVPRTQPQAGDLSCEIVTSFARLNELRAEWDRLWHSDDRGEIFQNYAWVRAFWSGYGKELELCTIVVRDRNRILGILPLAVHAGILRFLGSPRSDYNDIVCEEFSAAAVLERALDDLLQLATWNRCILDNVSELSRIARYLPLLPPRLKSHLQRFVASPCPTITLNGGETLRKSVRTHVRRQSRKLERLGGFTFRHMENEPGIERHLNVLFRQHMERQAFRHEPSQFAGTQSREYFRAMALDASLRPWLRFGVLELESQPLAYHFGFEANGKYLWYKPSFSIDYYDYSPGELLLSEVVKNAAESGLREVDLTIGDEPYKLRFATHVRQNFVICVLRDRGDVRGWMTSWLQHTKEQIREKPSVLQFARNAKQRVRQTWHHLRLRVTREGMIRSGAAAVRAAWRTAIWSADNMTLVHFSQQECQVEPRKQREIVVQRSTLGELALASIPYADLITEPEFQLVRERVKAGSELYLVRDGGKFVQYALACESAEIPVGSDTQPKPFAINEVAFVVHRLWTAPEAADRQALFTGLIRSFGELARGRGRELYVFLRERDLARSQIAGATVKLRLAQQRLFHKLRFESVRRFV